MTLNFKQVKNCAFWTKFENSLFSKNHQRKTRSKIKIPSPTNLYYDILVHKFGHEKFGAGPLLPVKIFKCALFSKNCAFLEADFY